ncbi:hypothetical protein SUGI_0176530 [Cryptomeria japonica]|uniref:protein root UVB sensitive 2, chloroplastic n=1 Tax=Cryptomeria japonica TaxID=3369 RepID=UPI002408BF50|nr:protein root UVB sensitive 2, chloroplastic [Cryptomeria japonica]GLJ11770.1 hypothetical protein SUGI_0176530 [Cryptomeria japonica]
MVSSNESDEEHSIQTAMHSKLWIESGDGRTRQYSFDSSGALTVKVLEDSRPIVQRAVDSFLNKFFPLGYPNSVGEGYLTYSKFRALQHFSSAALSVLSTQSLLFAAGLRPTPAQATVVSWVLKDGMQHVGKLICSNMGARMDSEPKRWRILADLLYDIGTGLEVLSPLCPQFFLETAGLGNLAKGMAVVAARATRLPIYSSFAKEGNLSDLYAKGEAISTLFNVVGLGVGIQLASTACSSMQGKLVAAPLLSILHIYSVTKEMQAAPVNTLNPQRTAMVVADFVKSGTVSRPADLRYRENLIYPLQPVEDAGSVQVGRSIIKVIKNPSKLKQLKEKFQREHFLLSCNDTFTDLLLENTASGEDALRGWLIAAYAAEMAKSNYSCNSLGKVGFGLLKEVVLDKAYEQMEAVFPSFISGLKERGWHTDLFLDGTGSRFAW